MAYKFLRNSASARLRLGMVTAAAGALLWPAVISAAPMPPPETVAVSVDQAKLVKLPGKVATIVVGNPMIADVTLQPGGLVVVTGKGYGATNFIALDRAGEIVVDRIIQVDGPSDHQLITVYRGIDRESYSCMPVCQRRVTLSACSISQLSTNSCGLVPTWRSVPSIISFIGTN